MHSLMRVLGRTRFQCATTAGAVTDVILTKYIVTAPFVSLALITRIHVAASAGTWILYARPASFSEEEPDVFFTTLTGELSQSITSASPNLVISAFTAPVPERVSLILRLPASDSATLTISADLLGRDA